MKSAIILATLALAFGAPAVSSLELSQYRRDSGTVTIPELLKNAITNAKQTTDTLVQELKKGDGHAGKDTVNALITGLDSQVDNIADFVTKDLNGVTLGLSGALGDFLLGPIFQGVTNGAEVIISNVIGGSVDMVSDGALKMFSNTLSKLHTVGAKIDVSKSNMQALETAEKQVDQVKAKPEKKETHPNVKRDSGTVSIPQLLKGAITNAKQTTETLVQELKKGDGHAGKDTVNALITGLDSQVDNIADFVTKDLDGVTFGLSGALGDFLLGPIFQGVTNGAEVIISNVIGGSVDLVTDGAVKMFSNTLANLHTIGEKINVSKSNMQALETAQKQISHVKGEAKKAKESSTKGKRDTVSIPQLLKGAITNAKQTTNTLIQELKKGDGHAGKDTVNALITGLDSQVDNIADFVTKDLDGVTFGLSGALGDFLLGPIFQGVTNGAEVIISNVIGGSVDLVTDGAVKMFSNTLSKLHTVGAKIDVSKSNMEALETAQKQLVSLKVTKHGKKEASKTGAEAHKAHSAASETATAAKRATDADLSGVNGSMTNHKQVLQTLNDQLKSHNGHAAQATINAFITGADSQIDNAIATVSDALAPLTLGASKAVGDFLLGPFVQAVTNGAEVLISNLLGGAIDGVSDMAIQTYTQSLNNLEQIADKYGVNDEAKNALAKAKQGIVSLHAKTN